MIRIWRRRDMLLDGGVWVRVFAQVIGETISPLQAIAGVLPAPDKNWKRTKETVRVNRSQTWAVWSCVDRR